MNTIEFSIIIPIFHSGLFLRKAIVSTRQIDFPPDCFEVLVVGTKDSEESRRTVETEAATAEFHLRYIECASPRRSSQLNAACAVARGRVLVFADDDCIFISDWLDEIRKVLQCEPNIGAIGGSDELEHNGSAFSCSGLDFEFPLSHWPSSSGRRTQYCQILPEVVQYGCSSLRCLRRCSGKQRRNPSGVRRSFACP